MSEIVTIERFIQTNQNYSLRTETREGKTYLIAPVIMMVEGVHCGSHGCLLHPIEELGKFPGAWNGRPVVVMHPEKEGQALSAGDPDVDLTIRVGTVYNTEVEDNKLKAEVWLDKEKLEEVSPEAFEYIQNGNPMDVSVGVFTDEEDKQGEWNGEKYVGIARNHRFDHLALLPGVEGACSWSDGCGIRLNSKFKVLGGKIMADVKKKVDGLITNEATHYSEEDREWLSTLEEDKLDKLEPKLQRANKKPCCPDEVNVLIKHEGTVFTEDDRSWLETLNQKQIGKLFPKKKETTQTTNEKKPELTKEDIQKVFGQYTKAEDFIALAPKEMQDQLNSGLAIFRKEREKMITEIVKYSKSFTEEELKGMDNILVQKIHSSVVPEGDYSGSNNSGAHSNKKEPTEEMKVMLGFTDKK